MILIRLTDGWENGELSCFILFLAPHFEYLLQVAPWSAPSPQIASDARPAPGLSWAAVVTSTSHVARPARHWQRVRTLGINTFSKMPLPSPAQWHQGHCHPPMVSISLKPRPPMGYWPLTSPPEAAGLGCVPMCGHGESSSSSSWAARRGRE